MNRLFCKVSSSWLLRYLVLQCMALRFFLSAASGEVPDLVRVKPNQDTLQEFYIRGGLPNFFSKAASGKSLKIGYIGGSITYVGERYHEQTTGSIKDMLPANTITEVIAGVPGTDADLGACRLDEQLLCYKPDLIFVEFAVNGGFDAGMEGIIRQIRKNSPYTDICFIYSVTSSQLAYYQLGKITPGIQRLEQLADYYHIPSVHMGLYPAMLVNANKLIPEGDSDEIKGRIVFSKDGAYSAL